MKFTSSFELAKAVRITSLKMVVSSRASHIGSALSISDILSVLYLDVLNVDKNKLNDTERDIFILSKGHACVSVYAVLGLLDFFPFSQLETYGKNDSHFMNHISHKVPGVEFSTGSLGHGLPFATGKALASKIAAKKNKIFVILGDGELDEGSNWEALLFAAHHKLDNLIAIIDYNNLQSLTTVNDTLNLEPLRDKFEAFGANTLIVDGHDHNQLNKIINEAIETKDKPTVIIAKTIKGKGVSYMENQVKWHYSTPNDTELAIAIKEINNA
jgi:transketolase